MLSLDELPLSSPFVKEADVSVQFLDSAAVVRVSMVVRLPPFYPVPGGHVREQRHFGPAPEPQLQQFCCRLNQLVRSRHNVWYWQDDVRVELCDPDQLVRLEPLPDMALFNSRWFLGQLRQTALKPYIQRITRN